jgi:2-amino-4-hydroxy-6-hydroxymethyldihydropteridine diphosphokinase
MTLAYLALGANLVDPAAQVHAGIEALAVLPDVRLLSVSSLYRSTPVGVRGQPDFVNAVVAAETVLDAHALLAVLLAIEARFGRRRDFRHAPRTLDLDLLLYGAEIIDTPELEVPHPRMHLRAFVLAPLTEIAPDCRIPGRGSAFAWLPAVYAQRIEKLATWE